MPFQVSPGVNVSEIDLTTVVPAVSSTEGAIAGVFRWGPVDQPVLVDSETSLVSRFGKPSNFNAETFFTASNFLSFGNKLYVSRAAVTSDVRTTAIASNTSAYITTTASSATIGGVGLTLNSTVGVGDLVFVTVGATSEYRQVVAANTTAIVVDAPLSVVANATALGTIARVGATTTAAVANVAPITNPFAAVVKGADDYRTKTFESPVMYVARHPGRYGSSLKISVCDTAEAYQSTIDLTVNTNIDEALFEVASRAQTGTISLTATSNTVTNTVMTGVMSTALSTLQVGDFVEIVNADGGKQSVQVASIGNTVITLGAASIPTATVQIGFKSKYTLPVDAAMSSFTRKWEYFNVVDGAPGQSDYQAANGNTAANDELHVVIVDEDGEFSSPNTVLEVYQGVSRAQGSKTSSGGSNYYKTVVNQGSKYVWFANDRAGAASADPMLLSSSSNRTPLTMSMFGGKDGAAEDSIALGTLTAAYDQFADTEKIDVSLILQGKARSSGALANYLIDNIAESRRDCVVFVSPTYESVVNNSGNEASDIVTFRNELRSSSYAVLDSGYKYQYDKYNDVYRYVPLNGDTAGLCVRTDSIRDPWFSPAGFNRGQIKNIIRLAYNPQKADRDILYKAGVNPVVTFPGQGTILYGDKTLLAKPSAFDRINVRRLFIVLEKAIATAAKFTLFEFNDQFTRARFVNLVEPFLRDVQGRRGIYDFKVVCDDTNNTGEVIDRNEFIGDIYIKPARSINFIQLNFVAVRTGVEFSEVVGQF